MQGPSRRLLPEGKHRPRLLTWFCPLTETGVASPGVALACPGNGLLVRTSISQSRKEIALFAEQDRARPAKSGVPVVSPDRRTVLELEY